MRKQRWPLLALVFTLSATLPASAQDGKEEKDGERLFFTGPEWYTAKRCKKLVQDAIERIERYTRMRYRRPVPVRIQPKAEWEAMMRAGGFIGNAAKRGLAFYSPGTNTITINPWSQQKVRRTHEGWLAFVEPVLIHEMGHALQHQNFYYNGEDYVASLGTGDLPEDVIDSSSVEFILAEGFSELLALRCHASTSGTMRQPSKETDSLHTYMKRYRPDKNHKTPFRVILSRTGYQDGITLLHHVTLASGIRGVRSLLYRQPPRELFFTPHNFKGLELNDPPEPDVVFRFLLPDDPDNLDKKGILLATNPGEDRFFERAANRRRSKGCLIGYVAKVKTGQYAGARYALYVADPDAPGTWSQEQLQSLKSRNKGGYDEKRVPLPGVEGVEANVLTAPNPGGLSILRVEAEGLVILVGEEKRTERIEELALEALSILYRRWKPTKGIYDAITAKIRADNK